MSDTSDEEYRAEEDEDESDSSSLPPPPKTQKSGGSKKCSGLPKKKQAPAPRSLATGRLSSATSAAIGEMSFEEALEILLEIYESVIETTGNSQSSTGRKRKIDKIKPDWSLLVQAFEKESGLQGIIIENIDKLIELISHPSCYIPAFQGNRILLSLVPANGLVSNTSIRKIVNFLTAKPKIKGKDKLRGALLKYLYGLYEYNLVDESIFYTPYIFGRLFSLNADPTLVTQVCFFLKKISHKHLITRAYILILIDNLNNILTRAAKRSTLHLLRHFKLLRPDLVPNEVFKQDAPSSSKAIFLSPEFRKKLFDAKSRLTGAHNHHYEFGEGQAMELITRPMNVGLTNRFCFTEFQLHNDGDVGDIQRWSDLHKRDLMRCCLKKTETLPLLAKDEAALDYLSSYWYQIFRHKFEVYHPEEHECYIFTLHRCLQMTYLLGQGFEEVNDWLLEFLVDWDSYRFRGYVFELLRFMKPLKMKEHEVVFQMLRTIFLYGEDSCRIRVFEVLGDLMISWTKKFYAKVNAVNDSHQEAEEDDNQTDFNEQNLQELLVFINNLVSEFARMNGHENPAFLIRACDTYVKMMKEINEIEPKVEIIIIPPITVWYMVVLSDSVTALDAFVGAIGQKTILSQPSANPTVHDWRTKVLPSFRQYLRLPSGKDDPPVFSLLFTPELNLLTKIVKENDEGHFKDEIDHLVKGIYSFSINSSNAKIILKDPSSMDTIDTNINPEQAKELTPNLYKFLGKSYLKNTSHSSISSSVSH